MLHQTVFKLVMGRVGSRCLDLPNGNRYHSGRVIPNRRVYQREWSKSAGNRTMSGAHTAAAIAARVRDPIRVWSLQEVHAKTVA